MHGEAADAEKGVRQDFVEKRREVIRRAVTVILRSGTVVKVASSGAQHLTKPWHLNMRKWLEKRLQKDRLSLLLAASQAG